MLNDINRFLLAQGIDPFIAGCVMGVALIVIVRMLRSGRHGDRAIDFTRGAPPAPASAERRPDGALDAATVSEIRALLARGAKIDAIKLAREKATLSLAAAKDVVESLADDRS
jgi:ribosomal protein L7/L12